MNTLLQERSISDGDILILAEPPRGKQNLKQHFRSNEGPSRLKRLVSTRPWKVLSLHLTFFP